MSFKIAILACLFASVVSFWGASEVQAQAPSAPSEKVTVEKVTFKNRLLIKVVGEMYIPKNINKSKKHAAIVVGHPFGGVKEQTSGLHAQKLAEMGYVALAFDASHYGESGGEPRNIEVPSTRVEDFIAAVAFLSNHPLVDENRIGVLGICGGGGYSVSAAQIDHRIRAIATVSMYDMGRARSRSSCALSSGVSSAPKSSASNSWRISISQSPSWGLGHCLTHSIASSFDGTCHSQNPAINSFVSANGPSITVRLSPENLTRAPREVGCNPHPPASPLLVPAFH